MMKTHNPVREVFLLLIWVSVNVLNFTDVPESQSFQTHTEPF